MRLGVFYRDLLGDGGVPRDLRLLSEALVRAGAHVTVYCHRTSESRAAKPAGVDLFDFPTQRPRSLVPFGLFPSQLCRRLAANVDRLDALFLVGSFVPENITVARAARTGRIPYVMTPLDAFNPALLGGGKGAKKRLFEILFEKRYIERATGIRLYSETDGDYLRRRGFSDGGRLFILKDGLDVQALDGYETRPSASEQHADPVFGYLGRIATYQKGLDLMIKAWAIYQQRGGRGRLRIVGPDPMGEARSLAELISATGSTGVTLEGPLLGSAKFEFLSGLRALVHPSRHDGIPRVIREALALGCPVLTTPNTHVHDLIAKHAAGWIAECDPWEIARALDTAAGEVRNRDALARAAVRASRELDWDRIAPAMIREIAVRVGLSNRSASVPASVRRGSSLAKDSP